MEGFSSGENVRFVLRLKETARCASDACQLKDTISKTASRQTRHGAFLNFHRAEYSTYIPRESLSSPVQAASAHPDDAAGLLPRPAASHPSLSRSVPYDTQPRLRHHQQQPLNDTVSSAPIGEKKSDLLYGPREYHGSQSTCYAALAFSHRQIAKSCRSSDHPIETDRALYERAKRRAASADIDTVEQTAKQPVPQDARSLTRPHHARAAPHGMHNAATPNNRRFQGAVRLSAALP